MTASLAIDLLPDGGIRVDAPGATSGLATLEMATGWMAVAAERGWSVTLRGNVGSDVAQTIRAAAAARGVPVNDDASAPAPWPRDWSSLQLAAASGLTAQVNDLLGRGASQRSGRRDHSPYRLAMRAGHIDVLIALRDAGAALPPGSRPPDDLPNAVVLRNYLPDFTWWLALAVAVFGIVMAVVAKHWAFLVVAAIGTLAIVSANVAIGRTRIAVDGPRLSVRHVLRWHGPIDLRELVAVGFWRTTSTRMSSRWRLVQTTAGPALGPSASGAFDKGLFDELRQESGLRVVTIYSGRGFLSPGFEHHLGRYVVGSSARISTNAQSVFDELGIRRAGRVD